MIVYEVNLVFNASVATSFLSWLEVHIHDMLQLETFDWARLYERESEGQGTVARTVHYGAQSRVALERYFAEDMVQMVQDGLDRFNGQFTADRRVLTETQVFSGPALA
jgi:hypothetical protein